MTIVPIPGAKKAEEQALAASVCFLPLVGAMLGAVFIFLDWACEQAFPRFPHLLAAALILAFYALLTGGLHHDGFTDVADAFWGAGSSSRERRIEIMKDSRVGAIGVTAIFLLLILEFATIVALPVHIPGASGEFRLASLLAFPILGRWVMAYLCVRFGNAKPDGIGAVLATLSKPGHALPATFFALAGLALCFVWIVEVPLLIPVLAFVSLVVAELAGSLFNKSLGGITGDIIGATGMLSEALVLLLLASRVPEMLVV